MQLSVFQRASRTAVIGLLALAAAFFAVAPAQANASTNFIDATTTSVDLQIDTSNYYYWSPTTATVFAYGADSWNNDVEAKPLTTDTLRVSGLKAGTYYRVGVRVYYTTSASEEFSDSKYNDVYCYAKTVSAAPGAPKLVDQDKSKNKLDISFSANACDGYQILLDPVKSGAKNITVTKSYTNTEKKTITAYDISASKKTAYKAKVRTYVTTTDGTKHYSAWSKQATLLPQPIVSKTKLTSSGSVKLTWNKVSGATSYTIYGSTKANSGYKKICTTKKTTKAISKIKGKKMKKGKTYYVYVVANKGSAKSPKIFYTSFYKYTRYV